MPWLFKFKKGFIPSPHKSIFITLFFTIFTTVTGVGIVVPLLPVYAHELGAPGIYVGLVFGAFSFSRIFLLPVFGRISDKKGRKPFILAGLAGYALVSVAFIFSNDVESLILIRFVQGIASAMIMPVVQAYIGEITEAGSEGYSMGLFNMSMFASLSLGPLMGGTIKDTFSMDASFVCMGILSAIGFLLSILFLPPVKSESVRTRKRVPVRMRILARDPGLASIFFMRLAYTSCIGVIWSFVPLFADREFSLSGTSTGLLVMLGVFISGMMNLPMGWVADRVNKRLMVITGGILCSFSMLMLTLSSTYADLIAAVVVFGIGGGITMPAIMALAVVKGGDSDAMASVMSIMTVAHSIGMMTGSMTAGAAMDFSSLRNAFPCGMIFMIAGVIAFLFLSRKKAGA
ncbi:MAG: MFS transporter [Desulfobacteraceae bacterium]